MDQVVLGFIQLRLARNIHFNARASPNKVHRLSYEAIITIPKCLYIGPVSMYIHLCIYIVYMFMLTILGAGFIHHSPWLFVALLSTDSPDVMSIMHAMAPGFPCHEVSLPKGPKRLGN